MTNKLNKFTQILFIAVLALPMLLTPQLSAADQPKVDGGTADQRRAELRKKVNARNRLQTEAVSIAASNTPAYAARTAITNTYGPLRIIIPAVLAIGLFSGLVARRMSKTTDLTTNEEGKPWVALSRMDEESRIQIAELISWAGRLDINDDSPQS